MYTIQTMPILHPFAPTHCATSEWMVLRRWAHKFFYYLLSVYNTP